MTQKPTQGAYGGGSPPTTDRDHLILLTTAFEKLLKSIFEAESLQSAYPEDHPLVLQAEGLVTGNAFAANELVKQAQKHIASTMQ